MSLHRFTLSAVRCNPPAASQAEGRYAPAYSVPYTDSVPADSALKLAGRFGRLSPLTGRRAVRWSLERPSRHRVLRVSLARYWWFFRWELRFARTVVWTTGPMPLFAKTGEDIFLSLGLDSILTNLPVSQRGRFVDRPAHFFSDVRFPSEVQLVYG